MDEQLIKRAYDFINNKTPKPIIPKPAAVPGQHNKGAVVHPQQDHRLKENRQDNREHEENNHDRNDHDEQERMREEEIRQRLKEENERAQQEAELSHRASTIPLVPNSKTQKLDIIHPDRTQNWVSEKGSPVSGRVVDHGTLLKDHPHPDVANYAKKLGGPGAWDKTKTQNIANKISQHPTIGPLYNQKPTMPKMASQAELQLRNDPHIGIMVNAILGEESTIDNIKVLRAELKKAVEKTDDVFIKNAIHDGISLTALLILNNNQ